MERQDVIAAVAALERALNALDDEGGTNPKVRAVHLALDRLHEAVRDAGGQAPLWNTLRGLAERHVQAALATVPSRDKMVFDG